MAKKRNYDEDYNEDDEDFDSGDFNDFDEDTDYEDSLDISGKDIFGDEILEIKPALRQYDSKLIGALNNIAYHVRKLDRTFYLSDVIFNGLEKVPKSVGQAVISEIDELTSATGHGSRGLEDKLSGLMSLCRERELYEGDLFGQLVGRLRTNEDGATYRTCALGVKKAVKEIAKAKDNPNFSDQLKAFFVMLKGGKVRDPQKTFIDIVTKPYMAQLAIISKGNIQKIPEHVERILADEKEREKYIRALVECPSSIHLPKERFIVCITNPEYKKFVRNWVGENASEDLVKYWDSLYKKYGYKGLLRLGKPLLKTIHDKAKDEPKKEKKMIASVYNQIPQDNESPPRWVSRLNEKISGATNLAEALRVVKDYGIQSVRERREKELRQKYASLVRDIKNTTPIARGNFSTTDVIMTLDEPLLDAMQRHPGKKTKLLESMCKNLSTFNRTYRESGLPATVVVELYNSKSTHKDIREIGRALDHSQKELLKRFDETGKFGILYWVAHGGFKTDGIPFLASIGSEDELNVFDKIAVSVDNARNAFTRLTLKQRLELKDIPESQLPDVIRVVAPHSLGIYKELIKNTNGKINGVLGIKRDSVDFSRFRGHENFFNMLEGSLSLEDAKTIAEVILDSSNDEVVSKYYEALKSLTPYARINTDRLSGTKEVTFRYGPIATALKNSSETELEVYGKIGEVYVKSSPWESTRERIGFNKLQEIVKKTAQLVESVPGLRERTDSFVGHIRNYTSTQERLDYLHKLEDIAKATVSATPDESQLLADIGSRHVGFTFTDQNLQKVRKIGELKIKLEPLKGMSSLVRSEDQLSIVLDYAVHNTPEVLATAYQNLRQGFSNDDEFYGTLAISRDKDLSQKVESINKGYRPTFLKFAASVSSPDRLKTLPESHFYLAAQAYEFARQHNIGNAFFEGLNDNLKNGTVDKWANTIIRHFREGSKGGGFYRKLGEENETRRYIQVG